ncbi:uncharacterized protein LOC143825011 [Paroedura picta]|uniref:uncharacterized protein LOC143825011 n=1 Tax=Paroedura picta TaxID=143630 RepID=UPI004056B8FD
MGEPSFSCHPPSDGCCLNFPETIAILVALIIVVQLALKLASVICYYLWYLVGVMFGMVVVRATEKPSRTISKRRKSYGTKMKPSLSWSEDEVPHRRRRKESRSPSRRCLHCTLEPLKVTMNLQNDNVPYRAGRHSYPGYPPSLPPRYYQYEREGRLRPRRASAPSAYAARYRDTGVGSSDPILGASRGNTPERRSTVAGTEMAPRQHAGEAQYHSMGTGPDAEPTGRRSRSRRPAKVYIYPVHPQTPPGSRSTSPERPSRRHRRRRRAITSSLEDQEAPEPRTPSRRSRDAEQQTASPAALRYHAGSTDITQGQGPTEPPTGKPRYYWSDQVSGADWVYQPVK